MSIEARGWRRSRGLPGPYTLEQLAQDVRDVITDAGLEDYVLVGHSAGGKVAQLVAAAPPAGLAELVLVAPVPCKPAATITPEFQEQLLHAYDSEKAVAAGRDHILTATPLSDDLMAQIVADSLASSLRLATSGYGTGSSRTSPARPARSRSPLSSSSAKTTALSRNRCCATTCCPT